MVWIADGKRHHDWGQTSSLIAALYELHRDRKRRRRPFSPDEFNPLLHKPAPQLRITVRQFAELLGMQVK